MMDKLPPGMVIAHKPDEVKATSKSDPPLLGKVYHDLFNSHGVWKQANKKHPFAQQAAKRAFLAFNNLLHQLNGHSKVQELLCQNYQENWHKKCFVTNTRKILGDANLIHLKKNSKTPLKSKKSEV